MKRPETCLVQELLTPASLDQTPARLPEIFVLQVDGVQPMVTLDDTFEAEAIVKADPGMQKLFRERYGITNLELVAIDPWYYGPRERELSNSFPRTPLLQ